MSGAMRFLARVLLAAFTLTACSTSLPELPSARRSTEPRPQGGDVIVRGIMQGSPIVGLPDGGLLVGMRHEGTVLEADGAGGTLPDPVASVSVSTQGDRGLIGLAVDNEERVFASYTDAEGRLRVSQVSPGDPIDIWIGSVTPSRGIGGALAIDGTGGLLLGVGAMGELARASDPGTPHAKILRLDPALGPEQQPAIVSSGWHEPLAFALGAEGAVWVLDRRRGEPSIIARGDVREGPDAATALVGLARPVGLASVGSDHLYVCDAESGRLTPFVVEERAVAGGASLVPDCAGAVVQLADGRIAYVAADSVKALLA